MLKRLIEIFTDEGDVVIDPCAGSGSRPRAARGDMGYPEDREFPVDWFLKEASRMEVGTDAVTVIRA